MIIYIARCKDLAEANRIQDSLVGGTKSLVYQRILRRAQDLDMFNAELLRSGDEELAVGPMAFEQTQSFSENRAESRWKLMSLSIVIASIFLSLLLLLGIRFLTTATPSTAVLIGIGLSILFGFTVFSVMGLLVSKSHSPHNKQLWKAERWLSKGHPVVLVASDDPVDENVKLPKNVVSFDQPVGAKPIDLKTA